MFVQMVALGYKMALRLGDHWFENKIYLNISSADLQGPDALNFRTACSVYLWCFTGIMLNRSQADSNYISTTHKI